MVIRFAGDSGDGMQLAGTRFTDASALFGNDLATLPNFPAEIRAPAGTLPGVSSFQVHIADWDILTPGDSPDVLVAMNPAALQANLTDLNRGGLLLVNEDAFDERNLEKAGYAANPLTDGSLEGYHVLTAPMEELTKTAVEETGLRGRGVLRSKNFFALGLLSWMYNRPIDPVLSWVTDKFGEDDPVGKANIAAFRAGYNFGITTEEFHHTFEVQPARLPAGTYTNITGNQALAWGLIAAAQAVRLPLFYGSYPITPASGILEELSRHKNFGVRTVQAEDEIAAVGIALGASFAGHLGVTGTSGPGDRPQERDHQPRLPGRVAAADRRRATRRAFHRDADQGGAGRPDAALYGRHGEAPIPVIAAASPERRLRHRDRGGPDRRPPHDAGDPALRRVHRQQLGAVGPPRCQRAAGPVGARSPPPTLTAPSCRTSATRTRSPGRGRCPAPPGWSTASEGWSTRT